MPRKLKPLGTYEVDGTYEEWLPDGVTEFALMERYTQDRNPVWLVALLEHVAKGATLRDPDAVCAACQAHLWDERTPKFRRSVVEFIEDMRMWISFEVGEAVVACEPALGAGASKSQIAESVSPSNRANLIDRFNSGQNRLSRFEEWLRRCGISP